MIKSDDARWLAGALLKIGAISISPEKPFTWASGLNAPLYCDNRLTLGYPQIRSRIMDLFEQAARDALPHVQTIAGTATAGIPHAAWLADRLDLPLIYVRGSAKKHGHARSVEGHVVAGQHCILVEDTLSTGKSSFAAIEALHGEGVSTKRLICIYSHSFVTEMPGADVEIIPLLTFETLLEEAESSGEISSETRATLKKWHADPQRWSDVYAERMNERLGG